MLVTIVAVSNADNTGLDLDRIEKVEELPDEVARPMLDLGTARKPSDDELNAYHAERGQRDAVSAEDALAKARADAAAQARESASRIAAAEKAVRAAKKNTNPPVEQHAEGTPPAGAENAAADAA